MVGDDITVDRPLEGLAIAQPREGFRYGSEAFWLVGFALEGGHPKTAIDLGTGSGIMACLLARAGVRVVGVELRPEWGPLWEVTQRGSVGLEQVTLVCSDARSFASPTSVDLVVSNPPFFPKESGPTAKDPWRAAARTESTAGLQVFVDTAVRSLSERGRACFVVPQERIGEVAHPDAWVSRVVAIGKRRGLVELRRGACAPFTRETVTEHSPRAAAWYALAMGRPTAEAP